MKSKKFAAVVGVSALVLSACAGTTSVAPPQSTATPTVDPSTTSDPSGNPSSAPSSVGVSAIDAPMPEAPAGLEKFYDQELSVENCGRNECGTVVVPLDYDNPDGGTIEIAYTRVPASQEPIGSLLVNPGGPGASGQDMASATSYYFSDDILAHFDIIAFDPRGVNESAPVDCVDDEQLTELLSATYEDSPEGDAQSKADVDGLIASCESRSGDLLPFVGTEEAARDMDVIRHVMGDPKLYYVGYSYGTKLGGMYAELFPQNVGRLVLDGAVDSNLTNFEQNSTQLQGFELALDNYLTDCLAGASCPFDGTVDDARAKIIEMLDAAVETPIPTSDPDRPLTAAGLTFGIITPLYDDQSWFILSMAFDEYFNDGVGDTFQFMFDAYTGRQSDGSYSDNSTEANWAINCADSIPEGDEAEWEELSKEIEQLSPVFGPLFGYSDYMCANWPGLNDDVITEFNAEGSDPIVVIGTVGDPATPYEWSVAFKEDFDNAVLLTWEGEGHTAYGRAGDCINGTVDEYLLAGTVPEDGMTCGANE